MHIKYPYPIHKIKIQQDIELAYMDEGKHDETLLFIHGLANYAPAWKYQIQELSTEYRCIALDLPGNGYSSRGEYPYSLFFYAECIKKFVDELTLTKVTLVGHSMGGQIAIMLSLRYPLLFDKLILMAPAGIEQFSSTDKMIMQNLVNLGDFFYSDEYHLENTIKDSFNTQGEDSKHLIHELKGIMQEFSLKDWKKMCVASVTAMLTEQVNQFLPQVVAKTLLLFGEQDRLIPNRLLHPMDSPEKIAIQGAALIPHSEKHMINHAGHFVHIEKHQTVNQVMRKWLSTSK